MMRSLILCLALATTASALVTQRIRRSASPRSAVKMIYGCRNPTGPFAGAPVQLSWRIDAATEYSSGGMQPYVRNGEEVVLGASNLMYQSGVEQAQCKLKTRTNGDTKILGMGSGAPTLVRSARNGQWGEWDVVVKGQHRWVFHGDQISLDYNNPEAAVLQLTEENVGMTWEAWQNGMAEQFRTAKAFGGAAGQQLPPGWYTASDPATGQMYYCNEQTGQCQWEPPQAVGAPAAFAR